MRRNEWIMLSLIVLLVGSGMTLFALWKFSTFQYDALDLAIYVQTVSETAAGNWFGLTIHPHPYLGDHMALGVLAIAAIFRFFPRPETLLILQAMILASSMIPVYWICRTRLSMRWSLMWVIVYALNPALWNANAFEFHSMVFAPLLILCVALFYMRKQFAAFLVAFVFMLAVREDLALIGLSLGAIALIDRRSARWWLLPSVGSIGWFIAALQWTALISGYDQYKFWVYYAWLGSTPLEMLQNAFLNPVAVIVQLFLPQNILFTLALLAPVAFVSLLKPKWLLLSLFPFLMATLGTGGANSILLLTHKSLLLLPGIVIAAIAGFDQILTHPPKKIQQIWSRDRVLALAMSGAMVVYAFVTLTPIMHGMPFQRAAYSRVDRAIHERALTYVAPDDVVVSSINALPNVADRPRVYSLHYVFIGHAQFDFDGMLPVPSADTVLLNSEDLVLYPIQFFRDEDADRIRVGHERLQRLVAPLRIEAITDAMIVFGHNGTTSAGMLIQKEPLIQQDFEEPSMKIVDVQPADPLAPTLTDGRSVTLNLSVANLATTEEFIHPEFTFFDAQGTMLKQELVAMGYGLFPTPSWNAREIVSTRYTLSVPENATTLQIRLTSIDGAMGLNDVRSTELLDAERTYHSAEWIIPISDLLVAPGTY